MASPSKSSRNRRLPSPRIKEMSTKDDDSFSKYINIKESSQNGDSGAFDENDSDEAPTRDTSSPRKPGVAYLTENLIKRLTKEENIGQITTLHVTLGKELNKKIKYLENLEHLKKLLHLNLNNHMIEKIEKLDNLVQLRELQLANNCISRIEGLDLLVHLTVLNLNGNRIESLPAPLFKKLRELQTFHIAHNRLGSLIEVTKLRPLQDLSNFAMEGNPMASMEHSRQFVIFQLRSLKRLDGKQITDDERQAADERFAQEEVRRLETEILRQKKDYDVLQEEKQQVLEELQQLKKLNSEQQALSMDQSQKIKELQRELEAKEELLASKTAELSKTCEKQFKLEQELAFYKLDAKFEHLGMLPPPDGVEFGDEEDESPYIGKARFKPNKFALKSNIGGGEQRAQMMMLGSRSSDRYHEPNKQVQQELHDSLILDLQDKERAIQQAEEALAQLNDQLNRRKAQLQDAEDKLAQIQQAINDQAQLLGDEERKLIEAIADKKNYIRKLQDVAKELEARMKNIADEMRQREAETEKLRQAVRNTPPNDPAYSHLQARLAAKEQQLLELQDGYGKLIQDHDRARARLQEETAAVKELEKQLAALRKATGDQDKLKEELKNVIDDLNDNLNSMRQQVAQQAKQINQLQQEKDALGQKLREMQAQAANNKQVKDNIAKLQQQLKLNEDALERERRNCEALRRRLSDVEGQAAQGTALEPALADAKKRLQQAEADVARLQNAMNKLKQQLQDDRRAADERLKKEQDKVDRALQAARNAGDKDKEVKELAAQVHALTADNASLAQRLKDAEDELSNLENLLDKEEVLERLAALKGDINRRKSAIREPLNDQDELGQAIAELHQKYIDLMRDLERERRKQPDGEVEGLQARLQDAERALRQAKDRAAQLAGDKDERDAKLRQMADELKKLRDKLGRQEQLEDELERAKAEHEEEMNGLEKQIAQLKDQLHKARHGLQDQLASSRAPLQAKIRDMEDEMEHLQDKLGKVKADNERLNGAIKSAEAGREDLEDRLAEMMDKLRQARAQAEEANARHERQRRALEEKVKALENELERARNRLQSLRAQAEERLQAEKEKATARINGLEDEIDGLKGRLRKLQDKADRELDRMRDASARQVRDLEGQMSDLRRQLDKERARAEEERRQAQSKEAGLQNLLGETEAQLQQTAHQSQAQQTKLQLLENEIDGLRKALKEAETQAVKDKLDKELEAVQAKRMRAAIQAEADKQLADAQQQVASLQSLLADKDRHLQEQVARGTQNSSDIAAQRAEIRNLASALAEQNDELERLKEDLMQLSRGPLQPQYFNYPDHSLAALANEVEALRAALLQKEQQVASLMRPITVPGHSPYTTSALAATPGVIPSPAHVPQIITSGFPTTSGLVPSQSYVPQVATSGLVTSPGMVANHTIVPAVVPGVTQEMLNGTSATRTVPAVTTVMTSPGIQASPGQIHHYHHFSGKTERGVKKPKSVVVTTGSPPLSPEVLTVSTVTAPASSVHRHHYGDVTSQDIGSLKRKKRKAKRQNKDVFFCNFPDHQGLEYEVGKLEGLLSSSLHAQKTQDSRHSLRMDLRELENEVEDSLKRRATAKLSQRHSLDGNLAAGSGRVFIMRAVDADEEDNFAAKYLQQSSLGPGSEPVHSSINQLDDSGQDARWEDRQNDLAHVESILRKRKAELHEMDAVLTERRRQLEDVVYKRKTAEGRLRRAEEDAGIIEQRAAETSVELIRAGNQLINLEIKEKAMTERQEHMNKTLQAKSRELKEIENSSEVVRQKVDKLNQDLRCKMEELENKQGLLKDVESRIQLSLRVEELRQLVAQTEKEEKKQKEKYVRALKEGEKALEDKTVQLARTRNEIQSQMTEFHELNSKISKLRTELKEVQEHITKEKVEFKTLSERRQEETRIEDRKLKNAKEKLAEINKARNESVDALKSHREEFAVLRKRIHDSMNKMKKCEEMKIQKETEYEQMLSVMNEDKTRLENELSRLKSEKHTAEVSLGQSSGELTRVTSELGNAREELQAAKETKDSLTQEISDLQQDGTERREELRKAKQEIAEASKELEAAKEKITEIQEKRDEMTAEMEQDNGNTEKLRIDSLPQESSTPKIKEDDQDAIISRLQENIKHLVAANEDKQLALEDARTEVNELKEFIETERNSFREYLTQMASESEVYRKHLASLQMEHAAEKQKYSMEKESLLLKTEGHRLKAKKVSEELSKLIQNHTQTKLQFNQLRDTLAKDVKELKEHIEGITIQMKAELARSLKKVENSKEQTSEEIENLREKEDEMEIQLAAIQQSINTAKDMALIAIKEKTEASKREKEEALVKEQEVKLLRQQTYLRAQIRQQMSTRAEALDEERKKAEVSLEGLKNKLKNLEEVISRKDSSVEDFSLKLLQNKVEAERTADSNKQIDELKRRLRVLEDEKDLIESQRNHLVALNEGANLDHTTSEYGKLGERTGDQTRTRQSARLRRSLDSLMNASSYTKPVKPEWELPCRDEVKLNTSFPGQFCNSEVSIQSDYGHNLNPDHFMTASRERSKLKRVSKDQENFKIGDDLGDTVGKEADKKGNFETDSITVGAILNTQQSSPQPNSSVSVSRKELSTGTSGKMVLFNFTNPEDLYSDKTLTLSSLAPDSIGKEARGKCRQEDTIPPAAGSAAMFADDKKSEFLSVVHRLKNEKVRELECSLQTLSELASW